MRDRSRAWRCNGSGNIQHNDKSGGVHSAAPKLERVDRRPERSALDSRARDDNRCIMLTNAKIENLAIAFAGIFICASSSFATTKGLSQIVTPDLQGEGDLSLSLQIQDKRIGNPYELQAELGVTKWAEVAVFQGFKPNEEILATEFGILTKEPYLLSIGFTNWSPRSDVDPQPYLEAGYYTEHNKFIVGAIHAGYKNEAILGYAYDFNKQWRVQVDFQSGRKK